MLLLYRSQISKTTIQQSIFFVGYCCFLCNSQTLVTFQCLTALAWHRCNLTVNNSLCHSGITQLSTGERIFKISSAVLEITSYKQTQKVYVFMIFVQITYTTLFGRLLRQIIQELLEHLDKLFESGYTKLPSENLIISQINIKVD